jgi:hypothetical protein
MHLLERLLRHPQQVVTQCVDDRDLRRLALLAIAAIMVGGLVFGAAVGSFRGGRQIAFAALKIPLATMTTLAVCGPAMVALATAFERHWSLRTVLAIGLAASARASLVLLALAPVLWLIIDLAAPYHAVKLLSALAYSLGGLSALMVVLRALGPGRGRMGATLALIGLFLLVGGQTGWVLRPYLGRPDHQNVPFIVWGPEDGGVIGALWESSAATF